MKRWAVVVAVGIELVLPGMALAADPPFPDWRCNQVKVPEISVAAVWAGPAIDHVGNAWEKTLRQRIWSHGSRRAARRSRTHRRRFSALITGTESERQNKAKLIFAGLFKTLDRERNDVMHGLERYFRKQREFSDQIRSTFLQLRELQDGPNPDQSRVDELTDRVEWDTRIFEERRNTISFVCKVPVVIEQRLFALARAIQQSLE